MDRHNIPAILAIICFTILTSVFVLSCIPAPAQQVSQAALPGLVCRPDQLTFTARSGQVTAMEQVINISNQGGGVLYWTISDNVRWIDEKQTLDAGGLKGGTIRVTVDSSGMAPGEYTGIITIDAEAAIGSPYHVPVFLTVTQTGTDKTTVPPLQQNAPPSDSAVIWKNQTDLSQYASVQSCIVSGSITNADRWWYLSNITIAASNGSALIAEVLPPGETVIYSRHIPCYQREEVKLKYAWFKP